MTNLTKKQEIFYSIALVLMMIAALIVEGALLWSIGMIAVAGLCVHIAEKWP